MTTAIRYIGTEGFVIPKPPKRKKFNPQNHSFLVEQDVAASFRLQLKEELEWVNRYRGEDQVVRSQFINHSLDSMTFVPNEVTKVKDDDIAEQFLESRFFLAEDDKDTVVDKIKSAVGIDPEPDPEPEAQTDPGNPLS